MEALDGNAIAGRLVDVFGAEMTAATGVCADRLTAGDVRLEQLEGVAVQHEIGRAPPFLIDGFQEGVAVANHMIRGHDQH